MTNLTNASKANIIALVNAGMILLISFGVNLSDAQQAAIGSFVNAVLLTWVGLTYKDSEKRVPDGYQVANGDGAPVLKPEGQP